MLAGPVNIWRVRVGDYRILNEVHDAVLLVIVVKVGNRRDVYR
jgi:mRNA interferase RelE/StbE